MAKKKEKRVCVFCREQEADTWPEMTWNGIDICFTCLENPRDGGAWWAAVYGVAQSQT